MALQKSVALRNAELDALEAHIGASPSLRIYSGAKPATTATAPSGTLLATLALPADWMAAAANGSKAKTTWDPIAAAAAGTAGYFRVLTSGGTVEMQGTVSAPGGGGDLIVDNPVFAAGQQFTVDTFTLTKGNA